MTLSSARCNQRLHRCQPNKKENNFFSLPPNAVQGKGGEGHLKLGIGNHLRPAHHSVAPHSLSPQRQNIIWPCKYTFYTSGALPFAFWPFSLHTYCKYTVENTWVQSSIALYFNTLHTPLCIYKPTLHWSPPHPHTPLIPHILILLILLAYWHWYYWNTSTGTGTPPQIDTPH